MRLGWLISAVAHVGAVLLLTQSCATMVSTAPAASGVVVPVEIVNVAPESNVRALSEQTLEDAMPEPDEQTVQAQPEPIPAAAATPPPPQPRQQADAFNLDAIARLVDRDQKQGRRRTEGAAADRTQQGAGQGTAEVVAMQDRVRALMRRAMQRCWRAPVDQRDPERLVVTVQFDLDRQGNLRGQPRVTSPTNYAFDPEMRIAVDNALRSLRVCEPFPFADDPVVGSHYETWARLEHTFGVEP